MNKPHITKKPKLFYGYWIVAATFFCAFIYSGVGFYAFSLFVKSLQSDFDWSRAGIMAALTILFLITGASSPFIGRVVDRYGARKVMAAGAFVVGLGFALLSLMNSLWHLYGGYIVIGVGMAAVGMVPSTTVISNWFEKRRGTAIGIMSAGIGAGGLVLAPLIGGYFIPNFGWRASYLVLAALVWILVPLILLVIRTKPADVGLHPDGDQDPESVTESEASPLATEGLNLKMALATFGFWLISVSFLAHGFSEVGILQSQVPFLEDIGFSSVLAAGALGFVGLWSTIGKFGFGWLCDQIPAKYACCIGLGVQLVGTIMLMSLRADSPQIIIWLYATVMGLGVGSWLPAMSIIVSTNFGLASYGAIFGMVAFIQSIGAATGPFTAGYIYDTTGSYHWAFIAFIISYLVAVLTILPVRRPKSFYTGYTVEGR